MATGKANTKDGRSEFTNFWENFQLLPWKWTDILIRRSRNLIATVLIVYAFALIITYFPNNPWIAPVWIYPKIPQLDAEIAQLEMKSDRTNAEEELLYAKLEEKDDIQFLDYKLDGRLLLLKQYQSIHFTIIAAMGLIVLIVRWRYLIPEFFQWLWDAKRLGDENNEIKGEYLRFLNDYQKDLKARLIPTVASVVLIVIFYWLAWSNYMFEFFTRVLNPAAIKVTYVMFLIAAVWIFLLGQYSWALYVTSSYIGKLSQRFKVKIQPNHPDGCGGLKPLGDFSLENILPLLLLGILFAVVSIFELDVDTVSQEFATTYLFVLAAPLVALAVFLPVWNIHISMLQSKREYLDKLGAQLKELEAIIHAHTQENGDLSKAKEAYDKLSILREMYPEKSSYPVWPFQLTGTVLAIFSPQIFVTAVEVALAVYEQFHGSELP